MQVPLHTPDVHSSAVRQVALRHLAQSDPPQSIPVSVPFCTWSLQLAAWHVLLQTPEAQSIANAHFIASAHFGQLPPQSTSVSAPFCLWSLQVAVGAGGVVDPEHPPSTLTRTKNKSKALHKLEIFKWLLR